MIKHFLLFTAIAFSFYTTQAQSVKTTKNAHKPNIIVIMADDMGFSDIGCYGGEIPTPNIDELAQKGVRMKQFYNNARCFPTRASLLTGLHPHQAGIGRMSEDPESNIKEHDEGVDGYRGYLSKNTVTIAEVLKTAGYHTYMSGKWHVGMHGKWKWPMQRGFDQFYGMLEGASSYFHPFAPRGITDGNGDMQFEFPDDYYTTDAFTTRAISFINEQKDSKPFFLYLAYNAPHWPLQAKKEDIALFIEKYKVGWDSIKHERLRKQIQMGLTKPEWGTAQSEMRPWNELTQEEKDKVSYRMAVYAAQVYRMDQNIGRLLKELKAKKQFDNTLIVFLSDNGGCAEPYKELGGGKMEEINDPLKYGAISYGTGWANTSNTPFKKWKNQTYEGGMAAPFIACWPNGLKGREGKWTNTPYHVIDMLPTFLELAGADYPKTYNGNAIIPNEGISMLPAWKTGSGKLHDYFYWEHEENCAIRHGKWKGVKRLPDGAWELYDLEQDRTERYDIAAQHKDVVKDLDEKWQQWADTHKVFPKGTIYYKRFGNKTGR
ncbi:arylsulfatase [Mucilaginibacter sp. JRF]|uniref:arylsulfatase n=1 Tax=Mucilaginibacter sp. JRF TaxID=2780088 RepID=UPI00187FE630|nr:arylsulfatase [Mucilaginibacter sp. JRF]MBE9583476.1 arylsulfatase [Mucilaginibacter sp. JRF]